MKINFKRNSLFLFRCCQVSYLHISGSEVNVPLELLAERSDDGKPNAFVTSSDNGDLGWHDSGGRETWGQSPTMNKLHINKHTPTNYIPSFKNGLQEEGARCKKKRRCWHLDECNKSHNVHKIKDCEQIVNSTEPT